MKILMLTFSKHTYYQEAIVSMAKELDEEKLIEAWTVYSNDGDYNNTPNKYNYLIEVPEKNGICKGLFNIKTLLYLLKWINKQNFDAIYFESVHVWNIFYYLFVKNSKIIAAIHDVIPHDGDKHGKIIKLVYKLSNNLVDKIVIRNIKYLDVYSEQYGCSSESISYLPLWFSFPEYRQTIRKNKVVLFGRINPYKGIESFYEIAKCTSGIEFELVGKVEKGMEAVVERCKKVPNISVKTGYIPYTEMENYFIQSDCIILPYQSATQSGIIIDAYKFSKPVIVFNVGAISEQVMDTESGYLTEPGNIKAFSKAITQLELLSDEEYDELTLKAYLYGYEKYSVKSVKESFVRLIMKTV